MSEPTTQQASTPARVPIDFEAVLASMQDQLDDLATVVEAQQRRLDALERKG